MCSIRKEDFDRFLAGQGINLDNNNEIVLLKSDKRKKRADFRHSNQLRGNTMDNDYKVLSFK